MHMKPHDYQTLTATMFAIIGLVHLLRLLFGWEVFINDWEVPLWLSGLAVVIAGYVVYTAVQMLPKQGKR